MCQTAIQTSPVHLLRHCHTGGETVPATSGPLLIHTHLPSSCSKRASEMLLCRQERWLIKGTRGRKKKVRAAITAASSPNSTANLKIDCDLEGRGPQNVLQATF